MLKRINLVLDTEQDADILAWLNGQSNKSAAVRQVLRRTIQGVTAGDLSAQMAEVTARLKVVQASVEDLAARGVMVAAGGNGSGNGKAGSVEAELPTDVLQNLDDLGAW